MKILIKTVFKRIIDFSISHIGKTSIGRYIFSQIVKRETERIKNIEHQCLTLTFSIPNTLNKIRVDTFSTKEPETLEWIDNMPRGSVLWDVGANVGLYSCYAAKHRGCNVFAFEPSVFNLQLLARNIFLNNLSDRITIVPLPLCDALAINKLNMTSTQWGGALSTFGNSYGYDGKPLNKIFEYSTIGLSMKDAVEVLKISKPDYLKIDVDGIEHLILKGGAGLLVDIQSVLVEINDNFKEQAEEAEYYLKTAGLKLKEKRYWKIEGNDISNSTYNQIWCREK